MELEVINQAVRRNAERFPEDFIFQLSDDEINKLVTNCDRFNILKHSSSNPFAFTEQGVAMLSSVLQSKAAIEINRGIMRAFVSVRRILSVMPGTGGDVKEECSEKEARKKIDFNR